MSSETRGPLEIVGTLPSSEALEGAINEITEAGWDRSKLSLLAQHDVLQHETVEGDTRDIADDPKADHQAVVSETDVRQGRTLASGLAGVIAAFAASGATILTGGTALAAVVGAAVAGGGAAAAVEGLATTAGHRREDFLNEQLKHGGILLWVKLDDPSEEPRAREILARHGAADIHVHPLPSAVADEPERKPVSRGG